MGETTAFVLLLVATLTRSSEVSPAERSWTRERLDELFRAVVQARGRFTPQQPSDGPRRRVELKLNAAVICWFRRGIIAHLKSHQRFEACVTALPLARTTL